MLLASLALATAQPAAPTEEQPYPFNTNAIIQAVDRGERGPLDYLLGVAHGLIASEGLRMAYDKSQAFCYPQSFELTTAQYVQMLRSQLKENPAVGDRVASVVLMMALIKAFPCETDS